MRPQNTGASFYHQTQVSTADKREIVLYLYDGAILHMNRAVKAIEDGRIADRCVNLGRAMDILMELCCMLDHAKGGQIADRLGGLYSFSLQQLLLANSGDPQGAAQVRHAISIISTIREGWSQIIKHNLDKEAVQPSPEKKEYLG